MSHLTRRRFLSDSTIAAAVLAAGSSSHFVSPAAEALGADADASAGDTLNVMVCGVRSRGYDHVRLFAKNRECHIKYICDVDEAIGQRRVGEFEKQFGYRPEFVRDMRRGFDDKDLDVVVVATPNHWHTLAGIWAMQAGKDVYVEKPVSHNILEGQRLVEAARKYKKICQTGTQSRSIEGVIAAVDYVQTGKLGDVKLARGLCYNRRKAIGAKGAFEPPKSVDYNLWVGPAEMQPITRPQFHYDWHWQYHWGNGDINNQGVHQMDVARWGLGIDSLSDKVISYGGRLGYVDAGDTANTQVAIHLFGDKTITFEVRGLPTDPLYGASIGDIFYGTEGIVALGNWGKGVAMDLNGKVVRHFGENVKGSPYEIGTVSHIQNFVDAVKSRNPKHLNAEIREGHLSAGLGHAATISYRLGKRASVREVKAAVEAFGGDDDNVQTLDRAVAHLKDNGVNVEETPLTLGAVLQMDAKTETFVNNSAANAMLSRTYRKNFEVPALEN
ncbi:MAG TPA: Gfo/Idh/MocA family oxidoreductase [Sedimentisphaerales bacterium]|nr:Gfo/Idh/MocA family oxidoreductase [Sedimentisphaerales bacterium]